LASSSFSPIVTGFKNVTGDGKNVIGSDTVSSVEVVPTNIKGEWTEISHRNIDSATAAVGKKMLHPRNVQAPPSRKRISLPEYAGHSSVKCVAPGHGLNLPSRREALDDIVTNGSTPGGKAPAGIAKMPPPNAMTTGHVSLRDHSPIVKEIIQ